MADLRRRKKGIRRKLLASATDTLSIVVPSLKQIKYFLKYINSHSVIAKSVYSYLRGCGPFIISSAR